MVAMPEEADYCLKHVLNALSAVTVAVGGHCGMDNCAAAAAAADNNDDDDAAAAATKIALIAPVVALPATALEFLG